MNAFLRSSSSLVVAALLSSSLVPDLSAQDPGAGKTTEEAPRPTQAAIDRAIGGLGADQYAVRQAAEDTLRRAGEMARKALEKAAQHPDPEVRHRVSRLLGELDTEAKQSDEKGAPKPGSGLRRITPKDGARVPPRAPDTDPRLLGEPRLSEEIRQMQSRIEQMMRELGVDGQRFPGLPPGLLDGIQGQGLRSGSGTSVQIGPDGVRVEVTETDESGESQKKVYEAESLEVLREKHPEIAKRFFGADQGSIRLRERSPLGPRGLTPRGLIPRGPGGNEPAPIQMPPLDGPKLGVMVAPVEPQLADYLGLAAGRGLYVSEVLPDSLAEQLGLTAKDVLLTLGGLELREIRDVAAALQTVEKGGELSVTFMRRGHQLTKKTTVGELKPSTERTLRRRDAGDKSRGGERR